MGRTAVAADGSPRYKAKYRDPAGRKRGAGAFTSRRAALAAAHRAASTISDVVWVDPVGGKTTFTHYVETAWFPSRHVEISTRAAYRSYLDRHLLPFFGDMPLGRILPSTVQSWVTFAVEGGLSPERCASTTPCCTASSPAPSATS